MSAAKFLKNNLNPILLEAFDIQHKNRVFNSYINEHNYSTQYSTVLRVGLTDTFIKDLNESLCLSLLGFQAKTDSYKLSVGSNNKNSFNYVLKEYIEEVDDKYVIYSGDYPIEAPNRINLSSVYSTYNTQASFDGNIGYIYVSDAQFSYSHKLKYIDLSVNINKPEYVYLQQECKII